MTTAVRMGGLAIGGAIWCAALVWALGVPAAVAAGAAAPSVPAVPPAVPAGTVHAVTSAAPGAGNVTQSVRGDHVRIEGKLYSPQALFLVSRRTETFGRDAVVPNYLTVQPDAAFLPYRLRAAGPPAIAAAPDAARQQASDTQH